MSLQPLSDEDAPALFSVAGPEAHLPGPPFVQSLGGLLSGRRFVDCRPSPRRRLFRQPGFHQACWGTAVTGPTVHQTFPHRQLGRVVRGTAFCRKRRPRLTGQPRHPVPPKRAPFPPGPEQPYLTGSIRDRQPEAEPLNAKSRRHRRPVFRTHRHGLWGASRGLSARRSRAWTTASCFLNTANRKASRSTMAGSKALRSTRRRVLGCAPWPASRPAMRTPRNSPRPRSGAQRRRSARSRAGITARSRSRLPAPTARSIPI